MLPEHSSDQLPDAPESSDATTANELGIQNKIFWSLRGTVRGGPADGRKPLARRSTPADLECGLCEVGGDQLPRCGAAMPCVRTRCISNGSTLPPDSTATTGP